MKIYLDSSVVIVFLFGRFREPERYSDVEQMFAHILAGEIEGVLSFYALPEIYAYVAGNFPEDMISRMVRVGLLKLLRYPLVIVPFIDRMEKRRRKRKITMRDPSDIPHVLSALQNGCTHIVAYDTHFLETHKVIEYLTPEKLLMRM